VDTAEEILSNTDNQISMKIQSFNYYYY